MFFAGVYLLSRVTRLDMANGHCWILYIYALCTVNKVSTFMLQHVLNSQQCHLTPLNNIHNKKKMTIVIPPILITRTPIIPL